MNDSTTEPEIDLEHPETPMEHYLNAEDLASCVPDWWGYDEKKTQHARDLIALAQVHATLALFPGYPDED